MKCPSCGEEMPDEGRGWWVHPLPTRGYGCLIAKMKPGLGNEWWMQGKAVGEGIAHRLWEITEKAFK